MADKNKDTIMLLAGGDVDPIFESADQSAELILPLLREADLRFGQCERTYSERGWPEFPGTSHGELSNHRDLKRASIWKTAGIDIISMASNHTMDWGPEALLDTKEFFRSMGKHVIGVGKDGDEARKPALVERNGVKLAFLAYCSVLRPGHQAGQNKPGCAPMRAHSSYEPVDWQPGAPPNVLTVPYEEDLLALLEDIRKAKQQADVVVMSIHWGLHHMPKAICDYQPVVAHAAIDAGADLILGHHPHCLKAIEVYKGKVCFYSLGNFLITGPHTNAARDPSKRNVWNLWWYRMDPECLPPKGMYLFPADARKTLMAKAVLSKKGVERVSFLPMFINGQGQPVAMAPSDPKFEEILEYIEWLSDCHSHKFRVEGNEVVVDTLACES